MSVALSEGTVTAVEPDAQIRMILETIGHDPALVRELVSADDESRTRMLVERGLIGTDGTAPTEEAVQREIDLLLGLQSAHVAPDRVVEWVIAIATAGAGAAAGACFGE
ncbi:MAG: hypothetical protein M3Y42_00870 [Actinomycetota bacterium]|nr:hypothetical protein [Actinomycetota bacterium]